MQRFLPFILSRLLLGAALLLPVPGLFSAESTAMLQFSLPADSADQAIRRYSEQSGVPVLFPSEITRDVRANAVEGRMTAQEALDRLLAGTGLVAVRDEKSGYLTLRRAGSEGKSEGGGSDGAGSSPSGLSASGTGKNLADETVVLSPFTVVADQDADRYAPGEATSGGRVRVKIFDSAQNVSVIGGEVLNDVGATRILDAMKYVAGVSESSIPNGLDRITIRGFLTTLRTVDGVSSTSQANIDPILIERIEIVKGPNAILAPAGVPGGTINNISKRPVFRDFTTVGVEAGRFDSSRVEFDTNRVFGPERRLAVRVIAAAQHGKDYWGMPKDLFLLAPMVSWSVSPTTSLTWQTHFINWKIGNYSGIAIDPTAGTANEAQIYQGVPRSLNIYGPDSYRQDDRIENTLTLLGSPSESISYRLFARHGNQYNENNNGTNLAGSSTSAGTNASSFNPLTGEYTPGIVYASVAPYATTPVTISRTYNRSGSLTDQSSLRYTLQADLVHQAKGDDWSTETLIGVAYNNDRGHDFRNATTATAVTLENFVYSADVIGAISRRQRFHNVTKQVFVNEKVTLWKNRVILNGGYSHNQWNLEVDDQVANRVTQASPKDSLVSYGAVVKPVENVALFYSHAQNAAPLPVANIAAGSPPTQEGTQDEAGVRWHLRDNRIRLTASYYDIQQSNTNIPNPANFAYPPPVPALPGLLADRSARGWEFEAQGALTSHLSVIGAYTSYENRNPYGQEFRGAAEEAWSALVHYDFGGQGALKGLSLSLGADYLSARAGDDASGFTVTGVTRKPTFYLPARTLVNLGIKYRSAGRWTAQLNIDNVLNTDYIAASLSRGIVWPGTPMNAKVKVVYEF